MTVNKVILVGNLGADPEVRTTTSGTVVGNLRIATTERQKDREGNWTEATEWHRVVCFGRTAENVSRYLRKGRQVYVEGRIRTQKWQDREGKDRWTTEIVADQIRFLGGRDNASSNASSNFSSEPAQAPAAAADVGGGEPLAPDDDIPF